MYPARGVDNAGCERRATNTTDRKVFRDRKVFEKCGLVPVLRSYGFTREVWGAAAGGSLALPAPHLAAPLITGESRGKKSQRGDRPLRSALGALATATCPLPLQAGTTRRCSRPGAAGASRASNVRGSSAPRRWRHESRRRTSQLRVVSRDLPPRAPSQERTWKLKASS